jgi:Na+/melibiose symporter-like transporter
MLKDVRHEPAHTHESPAKSLLEGLKYVRGNRIVLVLLVIACLLNLLAAPYRYAFLPLFARYILDAGAAGYGMLTAMAGVGALFAGIWVVSLGNFQHKGRLLVWSGIAWPISLLLFSASKSYTVSLALVFAAGLTQALVWTLIATLILGNTTQAMRGRVMGLRSGVVVSLPLGNLIAGAVAEQLGAAWAQALYAGAAIATMLLVVRLVPNLRRLE